MKAAIVLDDWKLPVFRKRLEEAAFKYEDGGAPTPDTTLLTVETNDAHTLRKVLERAHAECLKSGRT